MADKRCSSLECKTEESNSSGIRVSDSKTSISACSCGPECGPEKCDGRNRSALVSWDSLRTKIFVCLFVTFIIWLAIYIPLSWTVLDAEHRS